MGARGTQPIIMFPLRFPVPLGMTDLVELTMEAMPVPAVAKTVL